MISGRVPTTVITFMRSFRIAQRALPSDRIEDVSGAAGSKISLAQNSVTISPAPTFSIECV